MEKFTRAFNQPYAKLSLFLLMGSLFLSHPYLGGGVLAKILPEIGINYFTLSFAQWMELTVASLSMGLLLFLMSSGMTLVFGLMNVLNLAHGSFILLGAALAYRLLTGQPAGTLIDGFSFVEGFRSDSPLDLALAMLSTFIIITVAIGIIGFVFEKIIIRPVQNDALQQILITVGATYIITELCSMYLLRAEDLSYNRPALLQGGDVVGAALLGTGIYIDTFKTICAGVGASVFVVLQVVLNRTRLGLLIRAGVENKEMVRSLGFPIHLLFLGVMVAACILAATGGMFWGMQDNVVTLTTGADVFTVVLVSIIIGGLGSVKGCFVGCILCAATYNYCNGIFPGFTPLAYVTLMLAVLMWRPQGLIPVIKV